MPTADPQDRWPTVTSPLGEQSFMSNTCTLRGNRLAGKQQQPCWHVLGMPQGRNTLANGTCLLGRQGNHSRSSIINTGLLMDTHGLAATAERHLFSWQGASAY